MSTPIFSDGSFSKRGSINEWKGGRERKKQRFRDIKTFNREEETKGEKEDRETYTNTQKKRKIEKEEDERE